VEEITNLKNQVGKDIITYGGANFVSSLIRNELIDEFHIFVNPTAIGNGLAIFKEIHKKQNLKLLKATSFSCGIAVLCYELNRY
jgi:dihydrofolate reductase